MRVKHLWSYVDLPAYLKLVYLRLTARPIIVAYLLLTLFRFGEVGFQVNSLVTHSKNIAMYNEGLARMPPMPPPFPLAVLNSDKSLDLCTGTSQSSCTRLFDPSTSTPLSVTPPNITLAEILPYPPQPGKQQKFFARLNQTYEDGSFKNVTIWPKFPQTDFFITTTDTCLKSFLWPIQATKYALKEDFTYVAFEIWLVLMAIVAVLNESIPHMIASLAAQVLATVWNGYHILEIRMDVADFRQVIIRGTCAQSAATQLQFDQKSDHGIEKIAMKRSSEDVPVFLYNCISLIVACYLTPKVIKHFRERTAARMGDSASVHRSYKAVLTLSVLLQAATFFFLAPAALWVGVIYYGPLSQAAVHKRIYQALSVATFVLIGPWLVLGWRAVRAESRRMLAVFLGLSLFFNASWTAMFASHIYMKTFLTWRFFGVLTIAGSFVTFAITACAVWCRINFNKGLAERLKMQEEVDEGVDFDPASPSDEKGLPPDYPQSDLGYQSDIKVAPPPAALISRAESPDSKHGGRTYITSTGRVLIDLPVDDVPTPTGRLERTKLQVVSKLDEIMPRARNGSHARRPS